MRPLLYPILLVCLAAGLVRCWIAEEIGPDSNLNAERNQEAWIQFKAQFNKSYSSSEEEQRRMAIFIENRRYVESNSIKVRPEQTEPLSFERGLNALSDLTTDEINASRNGFRLPEADLDEFELGPRPSENLLETILTALNESLLLNGSSNNQRAWYEDLLTRAQLDYRDQNRVSRVKDQGDCGSCWAFATTGALESVLAARRRPVLLSEQNLIDCSARYGNQGCQGGMVNSALRYVRDHGIMSRQDYPYTASQGQCRARSDRVIMRVRGHTILPRGSELLLRIALALTGPIPVAIDASAKSFHSYKSGIYNDRTCKHSPRDLNHAVLLVGYGTSNTGAEYWIVKNSWGRTWGDNGYIYMARNRNNLCGIATYAVLPIS